MAELIRLEPSLFAGCDKLRAFSVMQVCSTNRPETRSSTVGGCDWQNGADRDGVNPGRDAGKSRRVRGEAIEAGRVM